MGRRILALLCIHEYGRNVLQTLTEDATNAKLRDVLKDACFMSTMPLWLDTSGQEIVPNLIAHETLLKADDIHDIDHRYHASESVLFLSPAELAMAAADGADPELLHRLSRKPLWSALLRDFLIVATDGICEANEPGLRLAAAVYATIVAANAANPASAAAFGVQPRSRRSELEGRLVNFHQPHWLQSPAQRQLRISSAGMASTDSIPLALKRMDVDELVKAIGTKSMARLYHSYLDVNRALFRHVRHASTRIFNDSQSDLKNLTILYETGVMKHHPLESDIYKYLSGLGTSTYVSHLLSQTPIVVTGFTRTATSFRNNVKRIPSDHQWRLCAMTFVCLGGFPDLVFPVALVALVTDCSLRAAALCTVLYVGRFLLYCRESSYEKRARCVTVS